MNPKYWELWFIGGNPGAILQPSTNNECVKRDVSAKVIDEIENNLPPYMRFINKELAEKGVGSLYVPKNQEIFKYLDNQLRPNGGSGAYAGVEE